MITNFESLNEQEFETLRLGVAWIAVLIAGSDGKIDSDEISWASKIAKIRSYNSPEKLHDFYVAVGKDFDDQLKRLIEESPKDQKERTNLAASKVEELNALMARLENNVGAELYKSFVSFATHVAKASGGFLRLWSVSYEENKYINLPMLNPIEFIEE